MNSDDNYEPFIRTLDFSSSLLLAWQSDAKTESKSENLSGN